MKREILTTKKYRKDLKVALKSRTFNIEVFRDVIEKLRSDIPLDAKYKNHPLKGELKGYYDCHVNPDWVLVYGKTDTNELKILELVRLGSHSNLF